MSEEVTEDQFVNTAGRFYRQIKKLQTENKQLTAEMDKWNLSAKNIEEDLTFEAENKRLKKVIVDFGNNPAGFDWAVLERIEQLETELVCANELCGGYEAELEKQRSENKWLKVMLIEERLPNFCTGVKCGCAERVGEARKKARIRLRQELEQNLKDKQ